MIKILQWINEDKRKNLIKLEYLAMKLGNDDKFVNLSRSNDKKNANIFCQL